MSQRTHHLVIDSRDRLNYEISSSHDCTIRLSPAISGFNKVEVLNLQLILCNYNITTKNNRISFNVGASNYVVYIEPTSYTPCSLSAEMKRIMELASGENFQIYYDTGYFRFSWTILTATDFFFSWSGLAESANDILGFRDHNNTAAAKTILSNEAVSLNREPYFYVQIPELGCHIRTSKEGDWATFLVFNSGNSGEIINQTMFSVFQTLEHYPSSVPLSSLNIRIRKRGGDFVDLNNTNYVIYLRLHYPESKNGIGI